MAVYQCSEEQKKKYKERALKFRTANLEQHRERERLRSAKRRKDPEQRRIRNAYNRAYHRAHIKQIKDYLAKQKAEGRGRWDTNPEARLRRLVGYAKARSKQRGMECNHAGLLEALIAPEACPCCGRSIDYTFENGRDKGKSASLDRRDNSKGYTVENTRIICTQCNKFKGVATIEYFEAIVAYLRS